MKTLSSLTHIVYPVVFLLLATTPSVATKVWRETGKETFKPGMYVVILYGEEDKLRTIEGRVRFVDEKTLNLEPNRTIEKHSIIMARRDKPSQPATKTYARPPLSWKRIGLQMTRGVFGAAAGTFFGASIGKVVSGESNCPQTGSCIPDEVIIGGIAGYLTGSVLATLSAGKTETVTGSAVACLIGGLAAGYLGIRQGNALNNTDVGTPFWLLAAPAGATVGFNLTRNYRIYPGEQEALLNIQNKQIALSIPLLSLIANPSTNGTLQQRMSLIQMKF